MLGALDEIGADEVIISGEQRLLAPKAGTTSIIIATRNKLAIISRTIPQFFLWQKILNLIFLQKRKIGKKYCVVHTV